MGSSESATMGLKYDGEDLRQWKVFSTVEKDILDDVELFQVFGESNECGLFVTSKDEVYAVGDNCDGQLGLQPNITITTVPVRVEGLCGKNVTELCCGWWHVIALCCDGTVYSMGNNSWGQLGRITKELVGKVNLSEPVKSISCGIRQTLLLTDSGMVYNFCDANQCLGKTMPDDFLISSPDYFGSVTDIVCGTDFSFAFSHDRKVDFWNSTVSREKMSFNYTCLREFESIVPAGHHIYGSATAERVLTHFSPPLSEKFRQYSVSGIIKIFSCLNGIAICICEDGNRYILIEGQVTPYLDKNKSVLDLFAPNATPKMRRHRKPRRFNLEKLFNDRETSDLTIKIGSREIYVHKLVLKTVCPHFNVMLSDRWSENHSKLIEINGYNVEVYYAFLKYLYTRELIYCNLDQIIEMWHLSNAYLEDHLKEICLERFEEYLTAKNVTDVEALVESVQELRRVCRIFKIKNVQL